MKVFSIMIFRRNGKMPGGTREHSSIWFLEQFNKTEILSVRQMILQEITRPNIQLLKFLHPNIELFKFLWLFQNKCYSEEEGHSELLYFELQFYLTNYKKKHGVSFWMSSLRVCSASMVPRSYFFNCTVFSQKELTRGEKSYYYIYQKK